MPRGGDRGGRRPRESVKLRLDLRYGARLAAIAAALGLSVGMGARRYGTLADLEAEVVGYLIDRAYEQARGSGGVAAPPDVGEDTLATYDDANW